MEEYIRAELAQISGNFVKMQSLISKIACAVDICVNALRGGGKIMFCGNGGSASQSQHLAAELVGRYKMERRAMNSISLTVDTSILTAVGNDYGYNTIFQRQVEGIGRAGDVLIGLSTSGNSENVVMAFEKAREMGIKLIAFTGEKPCRMSGLADLTLDVPSTQSNSIQEMHLAIGHMLCGMVEKAVCK